MRYLIIVTTAIVSAFPAVPCIAATKSMQCERYRLIHNDGRELVFSYTVVADLDANKAGIKLTFESKNNMQGPPPESDEWKIVWKADDSMRAVAFTTDIQTLRKEFGSPVVMMDVDFARTKVQFREAGGLIDFDEVLKSPWAEECKRLD